MIYENNGLYDEEGRLLEANPDPEAYKVVEEFVVNHYEAIEAVPEQGHAGKVLKEYPNGGRDVEWIVDVPGVEGREAYDEQVVIYRLVPYTQEELAAREAERLRLEELGEKGEQERQAVEALPQTLEQVDDLILVVADLIGGADAA